MKFHLDSPLHSTFGPEVYKRWEYEENEEMFGEDDDWEGIEKSNVAKLFSAASRFVNCGDNVEELSKLGNDVLMKFYGLHKVAMEGPCRESPPLALKVSARAKWNAWQRLGNMTPEVRWLWKSTSISFLLASPAGWEKTLKVPMKMTKAMLIQTQEGLE